MNRSIAIMEEEHSNINRALAVVRKICLQLMDGAEVPDSDLRQIIDFIRGYADKHHHGKEEKFLFPVMVEKMGPVADKLVTHGMLVEHDLGRADVLALETALNEYQKTPTPELKLDILSYAMAYAHLLQLHIEKEALAELRPAVEQLARVNLVELREAIDSYRPCPGATEMLRSIRKHGFYLRPLLGNGGDPAFQDKLKHLVHEVIAQRALHDLDPRALGPFFDYYLTFAISAEVGVLIRWLIGGMRESDEQMAGLMTGLMFVAPGDLYGKPIKLDVPRFALATLVLGEENND